MPSRGYKLSFYLKCFNALKTYLKHFKCLLFANASILIERTSFLVSLYATYTQNWFWFVFIYHLQCLPIIISHILNKNNMHVIPFNWMFCLYKILDQMSQIYNKIFLFSMIQINVITHLIKQLSCIQYTLTFVIVKGAIWRLELRKCSKGDICSRGHRCVTTKKKDYPLINIAEFQCMIIW